MDNWFNLNIYHVDSAWKSTQQSTVLDLMPPQEVQHYGELYRRMTDITTTANDLKAALYEARSFTQIERNHQPAKSNSATDDTLRFHSPTRSH